MTQAELLQYLVEVLEGLGVPYMISGSHAAMYYGEPRLTRDVDVVAMLTLDRLPPMLQRFPPDQFYVDAEAAREAVGTSGQFNIIHPGSGLKVDVYVNPDTPYDRARLARRGSMRTSRAPKTSSSTSCSMRGTAGSCTCGMSSVSSAYPDPTWTNDTSWNGRTGLGCGSSGSALAGRRVELSGGNRHDRA